MRSKLTFLILGLLSYAVNAIEIGEDNIVEGNCSDLADRIEQHGVWDEAGYHPGQTGNTHVTVETINTDYQVEFETNPEGLVCAYATVLIQLDVNSVSSRLDWIPDSEIENSCYDLSVEWHEAITEHELAHVDDNNRLESAFNDQAEAITYEVCDETEEDAAQVLNDKLNHIAREAVSEMLRQIEEAAENFHAQYGATIEMPSCCGKRVVNE
jgi:hypothetical protein